MANRFIIALVFLELCFYDFDIFFTANKHSAKREKEKKEDNNEQLNQETFKASFAQEQEDALNKFEGKNKLYPDLNQSKDVSTGEQKVNITVERTKDENIHEQKSAGNIYDTISDVDPPPKNDAKRKGKIPDAYFPHTTELQKKDINNPHLNKHLDEMRQNIPDPYLNKHFNEMRQNISEKSTPYPYSMQSSENVSPAYPYTSQPISQEMHNQFDNKQPIARYDQFDNIQRMSPIVKDQYSSMPQSTQRRQVGRNQFSQDDQFAQYRQNRNLSQNQLVYVKNEQPSPPVIYPNQRVIPNELLQLDQNKQITEKGKKILIFFLLIKLLQSIYILLEAKSRVFDFPF